MAKTPSQEHKLILNNFGQTPDKSTQALTGAKIVLDKQLVASLT
jgi:hypothetical protein